MRPQPSEVQGMSSPAEPPPEFRIDLTSKDTATDQACQGSHRTMREIHEEGSQGMATNTASQDNPKTTREVHAKGSSEGMTANKAFQDGPDTAREHEQGSSEDEIAINEDLHGWMKQQAMMSESKVKPEVVVNADFRSWFDAVLNGDWEEIEKILNENPTAMITKVMKIEGEAESHHLTMLDVAIMTKRDQLVEKLVNHLPPELKELNPSRALCCAACGGRMRMVKALVDKIGHEPTIIRDALSVAVRFAPHQKELMWYLARRLECTPKPDIMPQLIIWGNMDISLYLARKYPDSWTFKNLEHVTSLRVLGALTPYFHSGDRRNFWENCVYKLVIPLCLVDTLFDDSKNTKMTRALNRIKTLLWNLATIPAPFIKRIGESKFRHKCSFGLAELAFARMKNHNDAIELLEYLLTSRLVLDAASRGASEIVDLCLKCSPELLWNMNFASELIKEIVEGRHVDLFRLVKAQIPIRRLDYRHHPINEVSIIDAVTKWSSRCISRDVSGAAFLLQRELQWFQVATAPGSATSKVKYQQNRKSYWEDFSEQRNGLLKEAGQWMKDTSSSCSLVATLITTVAFAVAFTVPGGNDSNTGIPIFLKNDSFMVFVIADALALLCSVTATLMFLTILTSRYTIDDFLRSLPSKMVLGLTFLFLSLAFMLVAFGSALTIFLSERWKWSYIPITLLAAFPVALFIILQLPLYIEMVESTYWPRLSRPLTHKK